MKLDCTKLLLDWRGNPIGKPGEFWRTGPYLAGLLAEGRGVGPDELMRAAVLTIKLDRDPEIRLTVDDAILMRTVVKASPVFAFIKGVLIWMLDPDHASDEQRQAMERLYAESPAANPNDAKMQPRADA